ncbi:MAG: GMC family oxidoreductase N-terminal domain-containing protein [Clostridiales bacterium]|nr:GMC family oxidoreductase N-terminal domain-containing protein [Clostridiales bacterium]
MDKEFEELSREIPLSYDHKQYWSPTTKALYNVCEQLGFKPKPAGKMIDFELCVHCGRCVLGCPTGAKWDSRRLLSKSIAKGAVLKTGCKVTKLGIDRKNKKVHTVYVKEKGKGKKKTYSADLIILAAGGLNTPVILNRSGISCENTLFADPLLCVAAPYKKAEQDRHFPMPFLMQKNGYMLSPYMDYLSFFFNKAWRLPSDNILSIMIKLSDASFGSSLSRKTEKELTAADKERLKAGVSDCKAILGKMGIAEKDMFLGTVNAGHPGGMMPLTSEESRSLHNNRLPENLYIADASILPNSMGNPPIWTILALSKRIAKVCKAAFN